MRLDCDTTLAVCVCVDVDEGLPAQRVETVCRDTRITSCYLQAGGSYPRTLLTPLRARV